MIKRYTMVENYKGRADQIEAVMKQITDYVDMRIQMELAEQNDAVTRSSNFSRFIRLFEDEDSSWIDVINKRLEEI